MPQLDVATYTSQLFWLVVFFSILLFVSTRLMLPRLESILEARWDKIEGTRAQAIELQEQAQQVQHIFENHLIQARKIASNKILQASREIASLQEHSKSEIADHIKQRFQSAESKINERKSLLMNQVQTIAQSLTFDIVQKVLIEPSPHAAIEQAVSQSMPKKISYGN